MDTETYSSVDGDIGSLQGSAAAAEALEGDQACHRSIRFGGLRLWRRCGGVLVVLRRIRQGLLKTRAASTLRE